MRKMLIAPKHLKLNNWEKHATQTYGRIEIFFHTVLFHYHIRILR